MKLSVVIISYNELEYLPKAVESCLNQTFQEFEIIIVDDGSQDGSQELIRWYEKEYPGKISAYVMERNPGDVIIPSFRVSNVIKKGLSCARGEYAICLSGDDFFCDMTSFAKQAAVLDKAPRCVASIAGYQLFWNDGEVKPCRLNHFSPALYWSGAYLHLSCFMFRREAFLQGLFLERFCDDTGLEYSLALAGKWKYVDMVSFSYRQRDKSIMHEADRVELSLLELLLYQDVRQKRRFFFSTMSRFARPMRFLYSHREALSAVKYQKYLLSAQKYSHDFVGAVAAAQSPWNRCGLLLQIGAASAVACWFSFWRRCFSVIMRLKKR